MIVAHAGIDGEGVVRLVFVLDVDALIEAALRDAVVEWRREHASIRIDEQQAELSVEVLDVDLGTSLDVVAPGRAEERGRETEPVGAPVLEGGSLRAAGEV